MVFLFCACVSLLQNIFSLIVYADVCLKVLDQHFDQLCNISDLDRLLSHFEEKSIITVDQQVNIENSDCPTDDRMRVLLDNISLPLQNGSTEPFKSLIEILINHGVDETKAIASSMKEEVKGV